LFERLNKPGYLFYINWLNQYLFCIPEFILDSEVTEEMENANKLKKNPNSYWTSGNRYLESRETREKGKKDNSQGNFKN